jgi:hypothetical protein
VQLVSVSEVNLARVPEALEGEAKRGSSRRKGSRRRVDLILPSLPVNANKLFAVNRIDPRDSDSGNGSSGFPSYPVAPETTPS